MVHFINACACHGGRPNSLHGLSYHSRQDLLARLIKRRHHVRVLSAPSLYGKTSLLLEYAEIIFSLEKVYWMDGRSPCFLRDLDNGEIESSFLSSQINEGLFIVDDLPPLDAQRKKAFLKMLQELLKRDWEVLIALNPPNDFFDDKVDNNDVSFLKIDSQDFLLPETLINAYRLPIEREEKPIESFTDEEKIAALFWSQDRNFEHLLDEVSNKDLPDQFLLAMFVVLVLEEGNLEDIFIFMDDTEANCLIEQLSCYVHLGIDMYQGSFKTRSFSGTLVTKKFLPVLDRMRLCSYFPTGDALVSRLADALLGRGRPQRACELVAGMTTLSYKRRWFVERSEHLMDQACFLVPYKLYQGDRKSVV